jgi:hypothetical protein
MNIKVAGKISMSHSRSAREEDKQSLSLPGIKYLLSISKDLAELIPKLEFPCQTEKYNLISKQYYSSQ